MNPPDVALLPQVHRAHEQARDELRRADAKVSTLLTLVGAALAGVVALTTRHVSPVAMFGLWLAAAPVFASVLVLLGAIRPRLSQFPPAGSWLDAAYNGPAVLLEATSVPVSAQLAEHTAVIGEIAVRRYRRVSVAVQLLVVGLSVLAAALVLAVLT
ncbi:Pycsar system effector family protein [Amycolatopsis sp. NPDC059021]|uniref:Pycsar system effector family protein n=1 Tax=Amycolatopsis sp. NPDC059021 TaxID=3346704 RepID=UPI00366DAF8C